MQVQGLRNSTAYLSRARLWLPYSGPAGQQKSDYNTRHESFPTLSQSNCYCWCCFCITVRLHCFEHRCMVLVRSFVQWPVLPWVQRQVVRHWCRQNGVEGAGAANLVAVEVTLHGSLLLEVNFDRANTHSCARKTQHHESKQLASLFRARRM